MKSTQHVEVVGSVEQNAITIVDSEGIFVDVNEEAENLYEADADFLVGTESTRFLKNPCPEDGLLFAKMLQEPVETEMEIVLDCGKEKLVKVESEPVEIDGEPHVRSNFTVVEVRENEPTGSRFEDLCHGEPKEICENVRIDTPCGKMTLRAVVADLIEGYSEVEQYKNGALTMCNAVDERLSEEQQRNPDSKEVEVLREVKDMAFGLYNKTGT